MLSSLLSDQVVCTAALYCLLCILGTSLAVWHGSYCLNLFLLLYILAIIARSAVQSVSMFYPVSYMFLSIIRYSSKFKCLDVCGPETKFLNLKPRCGIPIRFLEPDTWAEKNQASFWIYYYMLISASSSSSHEHAASWSIAVSTRCFQLCISQ